MSEIGAGDDHGIHIGAGDYRGRIAADVCSTTVIGNFAGTSLIHVADHLQDGSGHIFGHDSGVISPHQACANNGDTLCHSSRLGLSVVAGFGPGPEISPAQAREGSVERVAFRGD